MNVEKAAFLRGRLAAVPLYLPAASRNDAALGGHLIRHQASLLLGARQRQRGGLGAGRTDLHSLGGPGIALGVLHQAAEGMELLAAGQEQPLTAAWLACFPHCAHELGQLPPVQSSVQSFCRSSSPSCRRAGAGHISASLPGLSQWRTARVVRLPLCLPGGLPAAHRIRADLGCRLCHLQHGAAVAARAWGRGGLGLRLRLGLRHGSICDGKGSK